MPHMFQWQCRYCGQRTSRKVTSNPHPRPRRPSNARAIPPARCRGLNKDKAPGIACEPFIVIHKVVSVTLCRRGLTAQGAAAVAVFVCVACAGDYLALHTFRYVDAEENLLAVTLQLTSILPKGALCQALAHRRSVMNSGEILTQFTSSAFGFSLMPPIA